MDRMAIYKKPNLTVISSAPLIKTSEGLFLYKPYETEMQLWTRYAADIVFCCPVWKEDRGLLKSKVSFEIQKTTELQEFDVKTFSAIFTSFGAIFYNAYKMFGVMQQAEHIHLRCPGNMGLIGCIVQVFFPKKKKTAKYAGNWDLSAKQPWSYRLQKWILNNTFLTKNMQVLVYGEWEGSSVNIKSFFTATYSELEKEAVTKRELNAVIHFLFVGTLSEGKRPLYAIQLVEQLMQSGRKVSLQIFGEGLQRNLLEDYIDAHNLCKFIILEGNQTKEVVLDAYKKAHFLLLPSKSEGWPKVVAEAMFWGCIPMATRISCVPHMLNEGKRGIILKLNLAEDVEQIETLLSHPALFEHMGEEAEAWSRLYTTERFENEIKNLL